MNIHSDRWVRFCVEVSNLYAMASSLDRMVACNCFSNTAIAEAIQDTSKRLNRVQTTFWMAQKEEDNDSNA